LIIDRQQSHHSIDLLQLIFHSTINDQQSILFLVIIQLSSSNRFHSMFFFNSSFIQQSTISNRHHSIDFLFAIPSLIFFQPFKSIFSFNHSIDLVSSFRHRRQTSIFALGFILTLLDMLTPFRQSKTPYNRFYGF